MAACSDAGPLGRMVVHPGPVMSYSWNRYVLPPWLVEEIRTTALDAMKPLERAYLESVARDSIPHYGTDWTER